MQRSSTLCLRIGFAAVIPCQEQADAIVGGQLVCRQEVLRIFRGAVCDPTFDLIGAEPAAFEKPQFQAQREALEEEFQNRKEDALEKLGKERRNFDVAIIQTPMSFSLTPIKSGEVLDSKAFNALPKREQKRRQGRRNESHGE